MGHTQLVQVDNRDYTVWAVRMYDDSTVFSAWEPTQMKLQGPHGPETHSAIAFFDDGAYGKVGSRGLPESIERLQGGSPERISACRAWRAGQREEAFRAILVAFPAAAEGQRDEFMAEITVR